MRDFGRARAKALADIKGRVPQRRRAGMPRFKKRDVADPTLNYTRNGFRLKDGRLNLANGVVARPVWSRELPATPSSVRVYRDSIGHWYASFVVPASVQPLPATGRAIGIDWGVAELATTTSDGHDLPHPQYGRTVAAKLARYQRMMGPPEATTRTARQRRLPDRETPGREAAQEDRQAAQDAARKWAAAVMRDFDQVAVEDFKPKFLAKSTMARKSADAAIGATKTALIEMGRKHGRDVRLVHPAHTTMDCRMCGARAKRRLPLSERTYTCESCGVVSPRDKNSAFVMLNRAGFAPAGVENVRPERSLSVQAVRARNPPAFLPAGEESRSSDRHVADQPVGVCQSGLALPSSSRPCSRSS
ncbi:RNA-guided endonuclease InsQ/TnpB family protein [Nocardia amamiensis]|uniref:RNA-guided endonuclease InsQ/TnpB family protein n=1 Tax=Nocardia amamiensis TaxID=404578 RepID=UPI0033F6A15F